MSGRLRKKLQKKADCRRLRQLLRRFCARGAVGDCRTMAEARLKLRYLLYVADFTAYRETGKPLLDGFVWIKAPDGPDLVWRRPRPEGRRH